MLSYETLDRIADSYLPLLAVVSLILMAEALWKRAWPLAVWRFAAIASGMAVAYGIMYLDHFCHIWRSMGLDFSTHTAVTLTLVIYLVATTRRFGWIWPLTWGAYVCLMLYQRYHSLSDILTTAVIVVALYAPIVMAVESPNQSVPSWLANAD